MPVYVDFGSLKYFRLEPGGATYDAAAKLDAVLKSRAPDGTGLLRPELYRQNKEFTRQQRDLLAKTDPGLLEPLGLLQPATHIVTTPGARPRAYQRYAEIIADDARQDYYLYVPVDYKERAFVPAEAKELTIEEFEILDDRLFQSMRAEGRVAMSLPRHGIETPGDFSYRHHLSEDDGNPKHTVTVFIAEGRSLEMVDDYRARLEIFEHNGGKRSDKNAPSLKDYPELTGDFASLAILEDNPHANVPWLHSLAGRTLLMYDTDLGCNSDFTPPDGIRFPTEAYYWLAADKMDKNEGNVPPPTPPALENYIKSGLGSGTIVTPEPPRRTMPKPPL